MIDKSHCSGCYNDVYNGQLAAECWSRKTASLQPQALIHVDAVPPYRNVKFKPMPTCYKAQRFVTISPNALDAHGYWRR